MKKKNELYTNYVPYIHHTYNHHQALTTIIIMNAYGVVSMQYTRKKEAKYVADRGGYDLKKYLVAKRLEHLLVNSGYIYIHK